jgi:hypothetical protein
MTLHLSQRGFTDARTFMLLPGQAARCLFPS